MASVLLVVYWYLAYNLMAGCYEFPEPLCPTRHSWDIIDEAKDMADESVKVSPFFFIGSLAIGQYFFTTRCADETPKCRPVKGTNNLRIRCETTFGYTYASITKDITAWGMIKIPVGCHCVVCTDFYELLQDKTGVMFK